MWLSGGATTGGLRGLAMALHGLAEAYEQLKLSHDLAEAINAAPSVEAAFAATLRLVSEAGDWVVAQVWLPDQTGEVLVCGPVWYQREPGFETLPASEPRDAVPSRGAAAGLGVAERASPLGRGHRRGCRGPPAR